MFSTFEQYLASRRPVVDQAFGEQVATILKGVPLKQKTALLQTLKGGKKIRGCLSCLVNDALGGSPAEAIPAALAIELIQAATLIHDDFVDQDVVRGNRPAAWTLEGARRAVLIGDVIFATAIQMMSDIGREEGLAVSRAIAQVSRGALNEPLDPPALAAEIESNGTRGDLYEKIIRLKTGVLFGTACLLGALAAKSDRPEADAFFRYGLLIGEAYQLADDLHDLHRCLSRGAIRPGEMAALAPALLRFAENERTLILEGLRGTTRELGSAEVRLFRAAAEVMKRDIGRRLRSAVREAEGRLPENEFSDLLDRAPWELIRVFDEASGTGRSGP